MRLVLLFMFNLIYAASFFSCTIFLSCAADSDYHSLNHTLIFAPSNMTRSLQCVQIEIIDDSLAEDWEMFTVLLSTNSSTVNLTRHEFDVFIQPNINGT